jgi:two-component system KDP operon response regulator KdpE
MQGKKILIIEDDVLVRRSIEETFSRAGAATQSAPDGNTGLRRFYQFQPDLVTLDLMMPHTDGWETCRQIRRLADTPIIMITALQDEGVEVRGLDMGAVDFITKPFSPKVLLARARAALRKVEASMAVEVKNGYRDEYLTVDTKSRRVLIHDEPVGLTKLEYDLLSYLVLNKGQVLTHEQILDAVWGSGYENNIDYVHVYMSKLRYKLEQDPKKPIYLLSERGVGYRFQGFN